MNKEKDSIEKVAIVMGSDSDLSVMSNAAKILDDLSVSYTLTIVSAHRTPDRLYKFAKEAHNNGIEVIIAGAGGSAHLPGMVAAITPLPVIGVPIKTKTLKGVDSLYSIVQMPPGIPVATVAIDGGLNAGLLAAKILATTDKKLRERVIEYSKSLESMVEEKAEKLEQIKYKEYLNQM